MGLWGGAGDGPLNLEPPTRWAAPWKSPSSRLGPSAGPSLLPPWSLQGHYDAPLTQGEVGTEAGGRGQGCCAQDAKAAVTRERGTPGQGSQAQARDGGPWVQLPSLELGGSGGSCLGWVSLEVELP